MTRAYIALSLALVCAGCSSSEPAPAQPGPQAAALPADTPRGVLPRGVVPSAYRLELQVDPEQPRFSGTVEIDVDVKVASDHIWLHGRNLAVSEAVVTAADGAALPARYTEVTDDGVARLDLQQQLPAGKATLRLSYTAPFDTGLEGLYRVREGDRWYAFTQMEPISARLCFPGFDEPAFKTPFEVTLVVRDNHVGIANTPEVAREPAQEGWQRLKFASTKPLPTYLIALAVGDLDVVEAPAIPTNAYRSVEVPLRGVAVKGKGEQLAYALKYTGEILASFENFFGMAYPFEKIDIVAVPDFAAGAMENVGLITFREWLLLLDESAPVVQKRSFAYVMAHELAHQWFGNLVTMPWWDDIWLNESFASWLEFQAIGPWRPEYKSHLAQAAEPMEVMDSDSLVSARQIREPILTNHDIHNAFDWITYKKGGGILSMFQRYLGPERFRQGVSHYLKKHSYGTGTYEDFLTALSEGSGVDVTASFKSFLLQPGVPLLEVAPTCVNNETVLAVRQERYFPLGSTGVPQQTWQVPMCVKMGRGHQVTEQCAMITEARQEVKLEGDGCADWVLPNADAAGYYRWSLPAEALTALHTKGFSELSTRDVMTVAESVHAGLSKGTVTMGAAAPLMRAFAAHPERAVAVRPMAWLRFARTYLVQDHARAAVEKFSRDLYRERYQALGLKAQEGESEDTKMLRRDVVGFMATVGRDPEVRAALVQGVHAYLGYPEGEPNAAALDVDLLDTATWVAGEEAPVELARFMAERLESEGDAAVRRRLLAGLGAAVQPRTAEKVRALTLSGSLRSNEIYALLYNHITQPENKAAAWQWLTGNYDALAKMLPPFHAGRIPNLAQSFCSAQDEEAVQSFFSGRVEALQGGPRNLASSLETIRLCQARVKATGPETMSFFAGAGSGQGASAPMP